MSGVRGEQIKDESLTGDDVKDSSLGKDDLNINNPAKAVLIQALAGDGMEITETGANPGTGVATIINKANKLYTQDQSIVAVNTLATGDLKANLYPNTRDDGDTQKALYVLPDGTMQYGVVVPFAAFEKKTIVNLTNSTDLLVQNALVVTVPYAGNYKIKIDYEWSGNSSGVDFISELRLDGSTLVRQVQEPQDSGGVDVLAVRLDGGNDLGTGTDQRHPAQMMDIVALAANQQVNIEFLIANGLANYRAAVYRSIITIERFS